MNKYLSKTVVVPWDFSEMSIQALQSALEMVDSPDKIRVIHVTPFLSTTAPGVVWGTIDEDSIRENLAKSFRESATEQGFPELNFVSKFGDPGSGIADFANEVDAGLLIISSHGRSGISRLLLGSVAERVVRLAKCPVLVLRAEQEDQDAKA